jgi:DNA-binding transcriptional regulator GbsR (MarR family)
LETLSRSSKKGPSVASKKGGKKA